MNLKILLISLVSIVWRVECAPSAKIPRASVLAAPAAFVAASVAPEWYCETICAGGCGGRPHYDTRKQLCRCTINEHIDDGDMELIQKTARIVNMKIKFDGLPVVKRSIDDQSAETGMSDENDENKTDSKKQDKSTEPPTKTPHPPKKFGIAPFRAPTFKPLFRLMSRHQSPERENDPLINTSMDHGDSILGQIEDANLEDLEPHHNLYAPGLPAQGKFLFRNHMNPVNPILGQINPSIKEIEPHHNVHAGYQPIIGGFGLAPIATSHPAHLTPALTRSLLMSVREKLDNLLLKTQQYPYQPAVTAHETESMRNTLKQITQVNVNVRPVGTTWGYFFNNLVNQLAPMLRAEDPAAKGDTEVEESLSSDEGITSTMKSKEHKEVKHSKGPKGKVAVELEKKTTKKTTTQKIPIVAKESENNAEGKDDISEEFVTTLKTTSSSTASATTTSLPSLTFPLIPTTTTTEAHSFLPIEQYFPIINPHTPEKVAAANPQFLPHEDGDEVVDDAEDYLYDDEHQLH